MAEPDDARRGTVTQIQRKLEELRGIDADATRRLSAVRHEWGYVRRYLEHAGGPTLKIHLARLESALTAAEPAPAEPSTPDGADPGTALHRPSRRCVDPYTALLRNHDAADLLDRAESILNEAARRGVFTPGAIAGASDMQPDVARWFGDYDRLART